MARVAERTHFNGGRRYPTRARGTFAAKNLFWVGELTGAPKRITSGRPPQAARARCARVQRDLDHAPYVGDPGNVVEPLAREVLLDATNVGEAEPQD